MMKLYSGTSCPFSHRCRIVLHEKGMDFEIIDVDMHHKPEGASAMEDLSVLAPDNRAPVLVERDLILHEANIINEYIDERFPHPQLMPADPIMRSRARLFLFNFEKELFSYVHVLEDNVAGKALEKARNAIKDNLTQLAAVFTRQKYMLGDEFSMLDVAIAPLLWRLEHYGIPSNKASAAILKYAERLFSRQAFIDSLTPNEKAMRR